MSRKKKPKLISVKSIFVKTFKNKWRVRKIKKKGSEYHTPNPKFLGIVDYVGSHYFERVYIQTNGPQSRRIKKRKWVPKETILGLDL